MENKYKKRKKLRIPEYNYSNEGLYFITICTQNRKCILSKILQNSDSYVLELLPYGKVIEKYIKSINNIYSEIKISNYIIMPNHIHFICYIKHNQLEHVNNPTKTRLPMLISTFKRLSNKEIGYNIWQRNYYEHIIRNDKEYIKILDYINNNPYNWNKDIYYIK